MQTQDDFIRARRADWTSLEAALLDERRLHRRSPHEIADIVRRYRSVCADLMRARTRGYSRDVVAHLDSLAGRAHNRLYGATRLPRGWLIGHFREFPRVLRRRWGFFLTASLLFYVPLLTAFAATLISTDFAEMIMPPEQLAQFAEMYSEGFGDGRSTGTDAAMAGHYIHNNIGIAFRCFATGVLLGFGSIYFLTYNGLVIGTTVAWVHRSGHGANIFSFICGHGPFELTAITIAGAAGLQMGYSLVETHGRTRIGSLRAQAPELAQLIGGAAIMLLIAAFLEGFWSPSSLPIVVKWTAGAVFSLALIVYLAVGGRVGSPRIPSGPGGG